MGRDAKVNRAFRVPIVICALGVGYTISGAAQSDTLNGAERARLAADTRFLSSPLLEGRVVGTGGARIVAEYATARFLEAGLEPTSSDGQFQQLTTVRRTASVGNVVVGFGPQTQVLRPGRDIKILGRAGRTSTDGELVFVGHGIIAPDLGWDDVGQMSLANKIALVLDGDPGRYGVPGFYSDTQTVYGLPDAKLAVLASLGVTGVVFVHAVDADVPYDQRVALEPTASGAARLPSGLGFVAWMTERMIDSVLSAGGRSYGVLKRRARSQDFSPIPVGAHFVADLDTRFELLDLPTVSGVLPGSGPLGRDTLLVTTHYDEQAVAGAGHNLIALVALFSTAQWLSAQVSPERRTVVFRATPGGHVARTATDWLGAVAVANLDFLDPNLSASATLWGDPQSGVEGLPQPTDFSHAHVSPQYALSMVPEYVAASQAGIPGVSVTGGAASLGTSAEMAESLASSAVQLARTVVWSLATNPATPVMEGDSPVRR